MHLAEDADGGCRHPGTRIALGIGIGMIVPLCLLDEFCQLIAGELDGNQVASLEGNVSKGKSKVEYHQAHHRKREMV